MAALPATALTWPEVMGLPKVDTQCEVIQGDTPEAIADKLVTRLLEEKVL
jgi:hypothetical protein